MNENLVYSKNGLHLTEGFEGCSLKAYQKIVNGKLDVPTIAYGHTKDVHMGMTCTPEQAATWLLADIQVAVRAVKRLVKVPLTQGQFESMADFTFNLGQGHLATSSLLRLVNAGDTQGAAEEFEKWDRAVPGLVRRRLAEEALFKGEQNG